MKAVEIMERLPHKSYNTARAYHKRVKAEIIKAGYVPVEAVMDEAGNCVYCGEAGRCPGYHTRDEVREAGFDA